MRSLLGELAPLAKEILHLPLLQGYAEAYWRSGAIIKIVTEWE